MPYKRSVIVVLLCCLVQLYLCLNIDSERLPEEIPIPAARRNHHKHRRRSVKYDPRYLGFHFELEPENTVASSENAALFNCKYRLEASKDRKVSSDEESTSTAADLEVRVEWRKDGTPISHSSRSVGRISALANSSLFIEDAIPADEGVYQCAVHVTDRQFEQTSPWIFLSRRAVLSLSSLQRFEHQPINQKVFVGQSAAFRCLLDSKPAASIEWYRNNQRLDIRVGNSDAITFIPLTNTLEIGSARLAHSGAYKCVARNGPKSRTSQTGNLDVVQELTNIGAISLVLEPRSQIVDAGTSFLLECLANGNPKPVIRWLHDSTLIVPSKNASSAPRIKFVGANGTSLLVEKAQPTDSGVYTCRAENGADSVDSSATITIRAAPKIISVPKDELTQETTDTMFECIADGSPKARITWYKNGEVIVPSEYFVIASNKLKIFGLVRDDRGVYQCFAENEVGSAQASAQLLVDPAASHLALTASNTPQSEQTPHQPLTLQTTEIGTRTIALKWDQPLGGSDIFIYHLFFREEDSTRERTSNSTTTTAILKDLQPKSVYVIRVVGENYAGVGKSSNSIEVTTKQEEALPGKVRNLRANVLGSETIQVDWDTPNNSSGKAEAIRYKLFYRRANSSLDEKETQVLMVKTSYTLHSMDKNTRYLIRVEAEGYNGTGPTSDQLDVSTLPDVPSEAPQQVRVESPEPGSIRIKWLPPSAEHRNGVITGYKIRYKTKSRGEKGSVAVVDGDPGTWTIGGLEGGAHYTIRIAAMTQNGTGPFSDWFGVDTLMEEMEEVQIAGAPLELRVHAAHDSVQISWLPPRDDGVMIRGYLIGWGINVPDVEKATVESDVRQFVIKGLKPSREYVVSLRAFNNVGNGFPIYETVTTTAYGSGSSFVQQSSRGGTSLHASQMSPPVGVTAEAISSSAIRVSWTDPNDGFNQYYTIRYSSSDDNGQMRQVNTSETEHTVEALSPNTQYEFSVRLVDTPNQWSMSAINRTRPAPPSSAPRDLTIQASSPRSHDDPNSVTLSWQPPKYANGEIEEYIVLYSDRLDLSDKDWIMDSVRGDRLSMPIKNLLPKASYYFKIQARNIKGYGPFSPVSTYTSTSAHYVDGRLRNGDSNGRGSSGDFYGHLGQLLTTNLIYVLIGVISVIVLLLIILLTVMCVQRKGSSQSSGKSDKRTSQPGGYTQGRKYSSSTFSRRNQPDLWINQQNGSARFAALNGISAADFLDTPPTQMHDMKRFGGGTQVGIESPSRYHHPAQLQGNGTLSRSYHHSSMSLEAARQRTPQILYTGVNRQPITKVDFSSDQGSFNGSNSALQLMSNNTPPPPLMPPPNVDAAQLFDGYQTVRGLNPLKSFAQMGAAAPSMNPNGSPHAQNGQQQQRTAHIVRPVVFASNATSSPTLRNGAKPAGIVIGQKAAQVPVGRATAQPRVNVANVVHSPYSTVCVAAEGGANSNGRLSAQEDESEDTGRLGCGKYSAEELKPLRSASSAEDINVNEIDHMIDTLQQLQQEFTER